MLVSNTTRQPQVGHNKFDVTINLETVEDAAHPEGADAFNHAVLDHFNQQEAEIQPLPGNDGFMEASSTRTYDDGRLVAVQLSNFSFSGGAHPNTRLETMLYDAQEGKQVTLPDLFRDKQGFLVELSHQVEGQLAQQGVEDYSRASWTSPTLENFAAFTPTAEGLLFAFPAERSGPFNAGMFEATVDWKTLTPLLDPQGPLQK